MPGPGSGPTLLGRRRESETLDRLLSSVRGGRSGVLVVRGEAGVGKTAMLDDLCDRAEGFRVVRANGIESEVELAHAGLHLLCAPFLDGLGALPAPQAAALGVAFGLHGGAPPDRFLIGLAVLTLLSEAAESQPLVCVVDDAQWLDQASRQVLAFVARRLGADRVLIVFAVRDPVVDGDDLSGLPELTLHGLDDDDARRLLRQVTPGPLDAAVLDRVVSEARGNPLALLELPRGPGSGDVVGGLATTQSAPAPGQVEKAYRVRLEGLPDEVRTLLLLAAAEPSGDPVLLWRATDLLGIGLSAADSVETDGLLRIDSRVSFRHPLVRSAIYDHASPDDRRAVHRALAEATDAQTDPDRRAWHRAMAADGPDAAVADLLERSSDRARARGGLGAAARFLERAAALSEDPVQRAERALVAAEVSLQAGAFDAALRLLATAEAAPLSELQRARAELVRADTAYSRSRDGDAPALLLDAATLLEPLDPRLAQRTCLDAWSAALFAGPLAGRIGLREVSTHAASWDGESGAGTVTDTPPTLLLAGFAQAITRGRAVAVPVLRRAAQGFDGDAVTLEDVLRWGWLATAAAVMAWDYDTCRSVTSREVTAAREAGALTVLPVGANVLAQAEALGGDFTRAASLVAEAEAVTEATGTRVAPYGALVLAGMRGRESEAVTLIGRTIDDATAGRQGIAIQYARWSAAMLYNGRGEHDRALPYAQAAADDTPELFVSSWATSELVESAVRSSRHDLAREAYERLAEATDAAGGDWALGIQARARALLTGGADAEPAYREAAERLARTSLRPELARAHLLYGEWLRSAGRRDDARVELRRALELFTDIRMEAFEERARQELASAGERTVARSSEGREELSAQEAQIAKLAASGHSNPEIGAQLFVSPRTVEWHLHKVFRKLGVTSRKELASAYSEA
ncbi:regulatory LuxR family protein [Mumia flava]|uniref:Regulatory LuxR family protein n=1 Tax=Mumia flava TaxID=1348852 RepID=A0A0B2BM33_9ACTN|nr:LuxR family transcriptional regulator [Mumia flava]PJJ54240.1 regulatory LuxR family protein [Mumia flava]